MMETLKVEKIGENKYTLIDGERRFRAATIAKKEKVPVIIMETMSQVEKIVKQFHLQETREPWTPAERSKAITDIAEETGFNRSELVELLGVTDSNVRIALAFGRIKNQDSYLKANIGSEFIEYVAGLNSNVKHIYQNTFGEEFDETNQKKFEGKIIEMCQDGRISVKKDFAKIKDAVKKEPKTIEKIIKDKQKYTPDGLFLKTKAQSSYYLRNMITNARYAGGHADKWLQFQQTKPNQGDIKILKGAIKKLQTIVTKFEKEIDVELN